MNEVQIADIEVQPANNEVQPASYPHETGPNEVQAAVNEVQTADIEEETAANEVQIAVMERQIAVYGCQAAAASPQAAAARGPSSERLKKEVPLLLRSANDGWPPRAATRPGTVPDRDAATSGIRAAHTSLPSTRVAFRIEGIRGVSAPGARSPLPTRGPTAGSSG